MSSAHLNAEEVKDRICRLLAKEKRPKEYLEAIVDVQGVINQMMDEWEHRMDFMMEELASLGFITDDSPDKDKLN